MVIMLSRFCLCAGARGAMGHLFHLLSILCYMSYFSISVFAFFFSDYHHVFTYWLLPCFSGSSSYVNILLLWISRWTLVLFICSTWLQFWPASSLFWTCQSLWIFVHRGSVIFDMCIAGKDMKNRQKYRFKHGNKLIVKLPSNMLASIGILI
jgi:hypothetical protein